MAFSISTAVFLQPNYANSPDGCGQRLAAIIQHVRCKKAFKCMNILGETYNISYIAFLTALGKNPKASLYSGNEIFNVRIDGLIIEININGEWHDAIGLQWAAGQRAQQRKANIRRDESNGTNKRPRGRPKGSKNKSKSKNIGAKDKVRKVRKSAVNKRDNGVKPVVNKPIEPAITFGVVAEPDSGGFVVFGGN